MLNNKIQKNNKLTKKNQIKKHLLNKLIYLFKRKTPTKVIKPYLLNYMKGKKHYDYKIFKKKIRIYLPSKKNIYYFFELFIEFICYIISIKLNIKIKKYVFYLEDKTVDSSYLTKYIAIKLLQKYTLRTIYNVLFRYIMSSRLDVAGLKICCSGRVTKKQRATYFWEHKGSVKLNTFSSATDYSFYTIPMKFGAVGIKVWLGYKKGREIEDIKLKDLKYCKDI
jgi:hypothetical protein